MKTRRILCTLLTAAAIAGSLSACASEKESSAQSCTAETAKESDTVMETDRSNNETTGETGKDTMTDTASLPDTAGRETDPAGSTDGKTEPPADTGTEETEPESTDAGTEAQAKGEPILFAEAGKAPVFKIIYGVSDTADQTQTFAAGLIEAVKQKCGVELTRGADNSKGGETDHEILINSTRRPEAKAVLDGLKDGEFAIRCIVTGDKTAIVIAYKGSKARAAAKRRFLDDCVNGGGEGVCFLLSDTDIRKKAVWEDLVGTEVTYPVTDPDIVSQYVIRTDFTKEYYFPNVRDATVRYENGLFYLYYSTYTTGQGPASWVVRTAKSLDGTWSAPKTLLQVSDLNTKYHIPAYNSAYNWAPEIHKYNGKYYLFTTYFCTVAGHASSGNYVQNGVKLTGHLASIILASDSPTGPFVPISKNENGEPGHGTPAGWDTIDLTLHVDSDGQPWGIFSRDWASTENTVGSFYAVKLSEDLSSFVSEPILLFSGKNTTPFRDKGVTDGCWLYRTQNGELLLLWSPLIYDANNYYFYSVATARSKSGKVEGPWELESDLLYTKSMYQGLDGGHPSLFTDGKGQMWLCIHTPNSHPEAPTFIPVCEIDNRLVWGLTANPEG